MKYSACIDMMFPQFDFYDRFREVKRAGLSAAEFWKWSNKDLSRVKEELQKNELSLSIFNLDSRNEALSYDLSRGILNAARKEELIDAFYESVEVCRSLSAHAMIVLIDERRSFKGTAGGKRSGKSSCDQALCRKGTGKSRCRAAQRDRPQKLFYAVFRSPFRHSRKGKQSAHSYAFRHLSSADDRGAFVREH